MKIDINIPDSQIGEWSIEAFEVPKNDIGNMISMMKTGRSVPPGTYKRLKRNNTVVMSNTPDEIRDFYMFIRKAKGHVLVNGLGMGVLLNALLEKDDIEKITVIEKHKEVIDLVSPYIEDSRVEIIHSDCFDYKPPKGIRYDAVWHDIWDYICSDNLDEMKKLHRKYGRKTDYQASWCRTECEMQKRTNY